LRANGSSHSPSFTTGVLTTPYGGPDDRLREAIQ
jgi:hypothetical protein